MGNLITTALGMLNFLPGWKRKIGAIGALCLAIIAAWNGAALELGIDFSVVVPDWINAIVLAILGVGVANADVNK